MNALLLLALAMGPFEKNHPQVDEGTHAYEAKDYDKAAAAYDAAAKDKPRDARVQYDRGLTLFRQGKSAEAKQAFTRAEELDDKGELSAKIHYNLGNLAAQDGDKQAAIREYRRALRKDPTDAMARHNMEVLMRDLPPQQGGGSDGGEPDGGKDGGTPDAGPDGGRPDGGMDAGRPDGGEDGGADAGPSDAGADGGSDGGQDGGADGGNGADGGQGDGGSGDGGQGEKDRQGEDGGQSDQSQASDAGSDGGMKPQDAGMQDGKAGAQLDAGVDVDKVEAEKLLDSFKSNEKNLQLWRFKQKTQRDDTNGKDW